MKFRFFIAVAVIFVLSGNRINADTFDVRSFGAVGDKSTKCTTAFQRAIDTYTEAGGGTVLVPAWDYASDQIHLKSKMDLRFETGATLWASRDTLRHRTKHTAITGRSCPRCHPRC